MLYIVATPIGNLDDISFRAVDTLKSVDLIAAEDTRHTVRLLNHFNIKTPLTSYHEHNRATKGVQLIEKLKNGANIALVSDAGMPGISDPGEDLVQLCVENNVEFTVIPGPSAFVNALVMSGMSTSSFVFEGFLGVKKSEKIKKLSEYKHDTRTLILYEAPHKLLKTLGCIHEVLGERQIALCRELTKKYEEVQRLTAAQAIEHYTANEPRGEFVLVIEGGMPNEVCYTTDITEHVDELIQNGTDKKDAIAQVAKLRGVSKRDVYNKYHLQDIPIIAGTAL